MFLPNPLFSAGEDGLADMRTAVLEASGLLVSIGLAFFVEFSWFLPWLELAGVTDRCLPVDCGRSVSFVLIFAVASDCTTARATDAERAGAWRVGVDWRGFGRDAGAIERGLDAVERARGRTIGVDGGDGLCRLRAGLGKRVDAGALMGHVAVWRGDGDGFDATEAELLLRSDDLVVERVEEEVQLLEADELAAELVLPDLVVVSISGG